MGTVTKFKVVSDKRERFTYECYCQDIIHWHINDGEGKESQRGWTNHMQNETLLADSWRKIAIFIHSVSFISCANGLLLKSLVRCLNIVPKEENVQNVTS